MAEVTTSRYTVGVFQDVEWAGRGLEALRGHGFAPESLTIIARESAEAAELVRRAIGKDGATLDIKGSTNGTVVRCALPLNERK